MGCSVSTSAAINEQRNARFLMNPTDSGDKRQPQQRQQTFSLVSQMPTGTLMQVCQGLPIKNLAGYVEKAKNYSLHPKKGLGHDEQAAIHLYTQQTAFYQQFNEVLRENDERNLIPWRGYLKLFLTALYKLPVYQGIVWRGVPKDLSGTYKKSDEHVWWAFSSCSSSVHILEAPNFLGASGARTLFSIEVFNGRLISEFSEYDNEDEILLLPGTHVRVISILKQPTGLTIIHLKQIEPTYFLFDSAKSNVESYESKLPYQQQNLYDGEPYSQTDPFFNKQKPVDEYYEPSSKSSVLIKRGIILIPNLQKKVFNEKINDIDK